MLMKTALTKFAELLFGVTALSIGATFGIIAGLGQTTSTGTCSAIAAALHIKVGAAMFLLYSLFLIFQILLLGKRFERIRFLQAVPVIMQTFILNFFRYTFPPFQALHPQTYAQRFGLFFVGMLLISLGFTIIKYARFLNYPPEAFCGIMAERLHIQFGTSKILLDIVYVLASILICRLNGIPTDMVREGTLIFAVCNGLLIDIFTKPVKKILAFLENKIFSGYTAVLLLNGKWSFTPTNECKS